MVACLPLPQPCSLALVDTLVAERAGGPNAGYFNGLAAEWRERVEQYLSERGNPQSIPAWPEIMAHRKRFITLYNSPGENSSQRAVLNGLRERKLQFCPSCGEEGAPNTLDHYLPKQAFPHFAVTPANLIPMCDTCQLIKGAATLDDDGNRIFLHPYYDDFLMSQVVRLVIGHPYEAPEDFVLEADLELPDYLRALVQRHIDGLELQRRYGAFFRDQYINLLRLTQEVRAVGRDIRDDIPTFKRLHELKAVNLWPHIFYAAVTDDDDLLEYLGTGDLPEFL